MLVYSTQHWCNQLAPSCTGGLPWDDYKEQWGSGLAAGGGVDYIGTTGGEATLSMGYTMSLHYGLPWVLWATQQSTKTVTLAVVLGTWYLLVLGLQ